MLAYCLSVGLMDVLIVVIVTMSGEQTYIPNMLVILISDIYSTWVWFAMALIELGSDTTWTKLRYNSYVNFVGQVGGIGLNAVVLNAASAPADVQVALALSAIGCFLNLTVMLSGYRRAIRKANLELATMR